MTSPMTMTKNDNETKWQWNNETSNVKEIITKRQNDNDNGIDNET